MKKNLYYRDVIRRANPFKDALLSIFRFCYSSTRFLLEVFIRKDFGERYFKLSYALSLATILAVFPMIVAKIQAHYVMSAGQSNPFMNEGTPVIHRQSAELMPAYLGWYLFLAAFVAVSFWHKRAIKRNPSVFDFARYSLSSGKINPAFFNIKIGGKTPDARQVECLYEPAGFFVAGCLLAVIGQAVGWLLIISAVFYGLGYVAAYNGGDDFIMDKIDQIILNEHLEKAFVLDANEDETCGFRFRGQKPATQEMRRKLLPLMMEEDEIVEAK